MYVVYVYIIHVLCVCVSVCVCVCMYTHKEFLGTAAFSGPLVTSPDTT